MDKALQTMNKKMSESTMAIQGFGKVGMHAAIEADALGAKVVAVSDVTCAIYDPNGLNIKELVEYIKEHRILKDYPKAQQITNDELLSLDVDVLAPCALDGVIREDNADIVKAKIIIEGANGPVTMSANQMLYEKGILVVPDILANGGGVVVSYFEWVQDIVWLFWTEEEVRSKLQSIMYRSFDKVFEFSQKNQKNMRASAMAVSLLRLEKAMLLRGLAW